MSDNEDKPNEQLQVTESEGRTTIVFKKAILKGKVTQTEVLNTIMVAAKLQAEYFVKKLGRGAPLDKDEIKSLKELADITKLGSADTSNQPTKSEVDTISLNTVKSNLYTALAEKLREDK